MSNDNNSSSNIIIGCNPHDPPQRYYLNHSLEENDSLWRLYQQEIFPNVVLEVSNNGTSRSHHHHHNNNNNPTTTTTTEKENLVMLLDRNALESDLIEESEEGSPAGGQYQLDDILAISPSNETIYSIGTLIPGSIIAQLYDSLNNDLYNTTTELGDGGVPDYILSTNTYDENSQEYALLQEGTVYRLLTQSYEKDIITEVLQTILSNSDPSEVDSEAILVDPQPTRNGTSTSLWVSHIQDYWPCTHAAAAAAAVEEDTTGSTHHHHHHHHHHQEGDIPDMSNMSNDMNPTVEPWNETIPYGSNVSNPYTTGTLFDNNQEDVSQLSLSGIFMLVVFVLGVIHIWQQHNNYIRQVQKNQRLTQSSCRRSTSHNKTSSCTHKKNIHEGKLITYVDETQAADEEEEDCVEDASEKYRRVDSQLRYDWQKCGFL